MAVVLACQDTNSHDSYSEASIFIKVLEKQQDLKNVYLDGIA